MVRFLYIFLMMVIVANASELRVKANKFSADEKKGVSIFEGDVNIKKGYDELNTTKLTIFVNKKNKPIKYIATGDVSFRLKTKKGSTYKGVAQKVIYLPLKKEYHFYKDVFLEQLDKKKEIKGDEVVLKMVEGKAYAKGAKKEPVIMIFDMPEDKSEK